MFAGKVRVRMLRFNRLRGRILVENGRPTKTLYVTGSDLVAASARGARGRRVHRDGSPSQQFFDSDSEEFCQPGLRVLTNWELAPHYSADKREAEASPIGDFRERVGGRPLPDHLHSVRDSSWHLGNFTR